jgi:tripartite-type tricarboxylate transporter receptor subunit TctC
MHPSCRLSNRDHHRSGVERRRAFVRAALATLLTLAAYPGHAQDFPSRAVKLVDGYSPGGATDVIARLIAPKLSAVLGQPVVVENRPGASGAIAAAEVAAAPPDGYTLLVGVSSTISVLPTLRSDLPYDTRRDLAPVAQVATFPSVLVVSKAVKAKNVAELIALAKSQPGKLNYASGGPGTANHLSAELFKSMAKVDITHVPYKGGAPAITAVLAGEVDMLFATITSSVGQIQSGALRALAVTGPTRSGALPNVPTVTESGLPGFEVVTWTGFLAPARTPAAVIAKLNAAINTAMADPAVRASLAAQATDVATGSPAQFATVMAKDTERWAGVIRGAGIRAQ